MNSPDQIRTGVAGSKDTRNSISTPVNEDKLNEYLLCRNISGISKDWLIGCERILTKYLDALDWKINKIATLNYINNLKKNYSICTYRKRVYQLRMFLQYLSIDWANSINPPAEPTYIPKHITKKDIEDTLSYFKEHKYFKQIKAVIYLGTTSGMRAEEIYQLNPEDIDLSNNIVYINHNPPLQTTKTKQSRVSFFTDETKIALEDYFDYFNNGSPLKTLFYQTHVYRMFTYAPIKVKDLRKAFSQEWDRRGGQTSIKKILMGHSLRGDVDLMHYNAQSPDDLKKIYDKVMNKNI